MTTAMNERPEPPKIGHLVKANVLAILSHCEQNPDMLHRLQDKAASKEVFGIYWPFLTFASEIPADESSKYWSTVYEVLGQGVRVSSQWYEKNRAPFVAFLAKQGIASSAQAEAAVVESAKIQARKLQSAAVSTARYKGIAIGNAQNLFVRTLLSNLGEESFTKNDWERVVEEFGKRCAYCQTTFDQLGKAKSLVMDHAVPINRELLGEHRLGNLVPACHSCNSGKGGKDYRDFCSDDDAIARIEAHMTRYNYTPIDDNEQIKLFVQTAHKEVRELSQRYLLLINSMLPEGFGSGDSIERAPQAEREEAERLTRTEPLTVEELASDTAWDEAE